MELQLNADVQARLDQIADSTGRGREELICDALLGYFQELDDVRGTLALRYEDVRRGSVAPISSDEVRDYFHRKGESRRS